MNRSPKDRIFHTSSQAYELRSTAYCVLLRTPIVTPDMWHGTTVLRKFAVFVLRQE